MNVSIAELSVLTAALLLYWFVPAALALIQRASRRQPLVNAPASAPAPFAIATAREPIAPAAVATPAIEPSLPLPPPRAWPAGSGEGSRGLRRFSLFDLRDAGTMVRPTKSRGLDRSQAVWTLVHAQRPDIGTLALEAPIDPSAFAVAGVQRGAASLRIVVWLFDQLWPETEDEAIARALFDVDSDGRINAAVEPI